MPLQKFEITNNHIILRAINLGGIITELLVPDRKRQLTNVVLGYSDVSDYLSDKFYLGCIVGRFANRIASGKLKIDGKQYQLATNNGKNHLHGGPNGFHKAYWQVTKAAENKLIFTYESQHLEEGYPGNLKVKVSYELTKDNELLIQYQATTDQQTVINLTNHSYFNLSGNLSNSICDHDLEIYGNKLVDVDDSQIPTGILKDITKTPFDFLKPKNVGLALDELQILEKDLLGFDHCYAFTNSDFKKMAKVSSESTGIAMEVLSTEPGMQFYTGNNLSSPFKQQHALCLETQHYPDSPNQKDFPTTTLKPEEEFNSKTVYKFFSF